jgi:AGZA family xanthine/uracil permease-like MFS transporter
MAVSLIVTRSSSETHQLYQSSRDTPITYFPRNNDGNERFDFFKKVVGVHPIQNVLNVIDWHASSNPGQFVLALITFLYVDILDCTATLYR